MAKQTGILPFTGKLGNLIGYRRNGSYFVRSMPEEVKQTTATRQSSRNFGVGTLAIPAQTWSPSTAGDLLEISVIAVRINPVTHRVTGSRSSSLFTNIEEPFNGATLEANVPGKGILLVTLQVRIFNSATPTLNRRFMAADIIAVVLPVNKQKSSKGNRLAGVKRVLRYAPGKVNRMSVITNSTPDQVHLPSGHSPTPSPAIGHSRTCAPPSIAYLF
ncbi:hypothetical protein QFZ51_003473 [Chitinophaga sp. W3I9]|uniref:hypothetical protein n=1 Tax=Chitinophaga sp. W3I9 TaxID=3373924 RepID=UPI003D25A244